MKSILIIGNKEDAFCTYLSVAASKMSIVPFTVDINSLQQGSFAELTLEIDQQSRQIRVAPHTIALDNLAAVFPRTLSIFFDHNSYTTEDNAYLSSEWNAWYQGWIHSFTVPVINLKPPELWFKDYIFAYDLLHLTAESELLYPRFISTNDMDELKSFFQNCGNDILYIPQSQTSIFFRIKSETELMKLAGITRYMNVTAHEMLEGELYYVYVTGEGVFAVNKGGEEVKNMPVSITNCCRHISGEIKIYFSQFLILRNKSGYYLLGLSLNPDLSKCSDKARKKILYRLLNPVNIN